MEFRILGRLEVLEGGREKAPRRAKHRALLALLLVRANEVVSADELIDGLWGGRPPASAHTALHGHVAALRKLLGATRIETKAPGYLLRVEEGELDASRFEAFVEQSDRTEGAAPRSELLREALVLWRGEPLGEFRYESFAQAEIRRLEDLMLAALERRIDADLELGRHADLIRELEQLLRAHPLRECFRGQLMLALHRAGRQADALRVYQEGRQALAEELGLDPGPALKALEGQILSHDPALELSADEAPVAEQARKVVTVLVMELVTTGIDPEDFDRVVRPGLDRARSLLEGFGASVEPLFANALVAIFGAPRVHEDDPERAMRAARALVDDFQENGRVRVRVGIERGEALVSVEGEHVEVTGDVLAAASRLQATARAGEVVAGESVERALRDSDLRREVPFVGRRHELALLEHTYERVARENAVQLVTVIGVPGSGKTRLAQRFRWLLEDKRQLAWRQGRCLPYGDGVTFWALGEVVKAQAGILESDDPETSARKLRAALDSLLPGSDELAWLETSLSPLVGVAGSAPSSRAQSFTAWRRFLEAIAWHEPLVVLIEDLHWADPALLEFVDDLVARAGVAPLLVLCTARPELLDAHLQWAGGKRNATTITLPPLSEDETRQVARSVLGGEEPSEALLMRSGGNPLFAQELARIAATDASLPESLQAVIAARLDTLAPAAKQAAMDAAVMGEVFWPGAVAAIAGTDEAEIDERLQRLVVGDVVRRAATSSVTRQSEYAFLHMLVRDVAYNQIPRRRRAQKHEAAAAWIERLAGERVTDHAELIAHHYGAALELAYAAGDSADDLRELRAKTRRFLVLAGDRAMPLDIKTAERFYRLALALFDKDDNERARVLSAVAGAAQEGGSLEEAIRLYEEAIDEFRRQDDPLGLGNALVNYELALWRRGRREHRGNLLAEAVDILEREPPGPELADAYNHTARRYMVGGRPTDCLQWAKKAIALEEQLGLHRHRVRALQLRGVARCALNDLGGLDDLRESLRLGLEIGAGVETGLAYVNLAEWVFWTEGPERCLEHLDKGIEFSERHGLEHNAFWLRHDKLRRLFDAGRWDELLAVVDEVLTWDRAQGETQITTVALVEKAGVLVRRGAVTEAKALVDATLESAREVDDPQILAPALVCAALVERDRGDDVAAIQRLEELELSTNDRAPIWRALWIADTARVCAAAGALDLAKRLMSNLDVVAPRHVYGVLSARAVLAESESRFEEALTGYTEAAAHWHEFGNVFEEAHALLGEGRCLVQLDRRTHAEAPITAARAIFAQLGATPLAAAADRLSAEGLVPG